MARRQLKGWCNVYWEYVSSCMMMDGEYMDVKKVLSQPEDMDDHEAWKDYFDSLEGLDEDEYLDFSHDIIPPCSWMLGTRPMCWARGVPQWAAHFDYIP